MVITSMIETDSLEMEIDIFIAREFTRVPFMWTHIYILFLSTKSSTEPSTSKKPTISRGGFDGLTVASSVGCAVGCSVGFAVGVPVGAPVVNFGGTPSVMLFPTSKKSTSG